MRFRYEVSGESCKKNNSLPQFDATLDVNEPSFDTIVSRLPVPSSFPRRKTRTTRGESSEDVIHLDTHPVHEYPVEWVEWWRNTSKRCSSHGTVEDFQPKRTGGSTSEGSPKTVVGHWKR